MSQASNKLGMFSEIMETFEEVNKRFFRTIRGLILQPGHVVRETIADPKSTEFVNPFRFAFVGLAFYVLLATYFDLQMSDLIMQSMGEEDHSKHDFLPVLWRILDSATIYLSFISLIPVAWFANKIFRTDQESAFACYKLSLYLITLSSIAVVALVALFKSALPIAESQSIMLLNILGTLSFIYVGWGYKQFYQLTLWTSIWKTFLVYIVFQIAVFVVIMIFTFCVGLYIGFSDQMKLDQATNSEIVLPEAAPSN